MSNGPVVPLLRPTLWAVSHEEWRDDALCNGLPVEQFELSDDLTPDDQHELIAQGLKVCASCPVRQECRTNSGELDRHWTTRGGQPPEGLFPDSKTPRYQFPQARPGGFLPGGNTGRKPKEKCKHGHINWAEPDASGKRRCKTCQLEYNQRGWAVRKAKQKAKIRATLA
jgi:hypothetical protein